MDLTPTPTPNRPLSHKEYLDTLERPSPADIRRISDVQLQKEQATATRYHSEEEHDAAKLIQRAYRGHRERRQIDGLNLDPSSRWLEIIKEWQYRSATAPHLNYINSHMPDGRVRSKSTSEQARMNWRRAEAIAKHAGAGESTSALEQQPEPSSSFGSRRSRKVKYEEPSTMLLDLRYFLEMVDQKHRYGANLQVYHEQWQQSQTDQNFFHWLDHGDGRDLDLSMCSRDKLERERIRYLSKEERKDYLVEVDSEGMLRWAKNNELITTSVDQYQDSMHGIVPKGSTDPAYTDPESREKADADASFSTKLAAVGGLFRDTLLSDNASQFESSSSSSASSSTSGSEAARRGATEDGTPGVPKKQGKKFHASPATILNHLLRASVRPGTWIYVADTVGRLYVGIKSSGAFQHASFLSGARISSAGIIGIKDGKLIYLSPLSGHYRPTTRSFRRFIDSLKDQGVDMKKTKVSKSYAVLLGMEYYGKGKKDLGKVFRPGHDEVKQKRKEARMQERMEKRLAKRNGDDPDLLTVSSIAVGKPRASFSAYATEEVERNWRAEHGETYREGRRRGLSRVLMGWDQEEKEFRSMQS